MTNIEISPAEKLAEAMKAPPDNRVELQIAGSSIEQLDAVAKVILEKGIVIDENNRSLMRARLDVLRSLETTDRSLASLESRVHLIRLLEVRAPAPTTAPQSFLDTPASVLRVIAERTKNVPGINFVTGFFKDIQGRSIEKAWYSVLAIFEKNPGATSALGGAAMGPIGSLIGMVGLNFGARRKLMEFDVLDAIDQEKLAGESITFAGIAPADIDRMKEKLTNANIVDLTRKYIRDQRKIVPAGQQISVTLEAVLTPEQTQSKIAEREVQAKKNRIMDAWKPLDIASIEFKSPISAKKNGAGRFDVSIPESDIAGTTPNSTSARKLQEAMTVLTNAKEITIVPETERLTIDLRTKSVLVPLNAPVLTDSVNRGFAISNPRLERIVFGTPAELPIKTMQAKFDAGTLVLGANEARMQALEQISGLDGFLESAQNGSIFAFAGGTWTAPGTPTSLPTF